MPYYIYIHKHCDRMQIPLRVHLRSFARSPTSIPGRVGFAVVRLFGSELCFYFRIPQIVQINFTHSEQLGGDFFFFYLDSSTLWRMLCNGYDKRTI